MYFRNRAFRLSENGSGSGQNPGSAAGAGDSGQNQNGGGENGSAANQNGAAGAEQQQQQEARPIFTQADLDRIVKQRLDEEKARNERRLQEQQSRAEQQRLAEQGEFKTLYEQQKTEAESLRTKAELADRLSGTINAQIEEEVKGWPEAFRLSDPGPDNLDARLTWQGQQRKAVQVLQSTLAGKLPTDLGSAHGGGGGLTTEQIIERKKQSAEYAAL